MIFSTFAPPYAASVASTGEARQNLRAAMLKVTQDHTAAADAELRKAIEQPDFFGIGASEQHVALALAAESSLRLGQPRLAQQFAIRATSLPESTIDDWSSRWRAAMKLNDGVEEARSLNEIGRRWGRALLDLPDGQIDQAIRDSDAAGAEKERFELLQRLYEFRWAPRRGTDPSWEWRELTLALLSNNSTDRAADVAQHITDPYERVAMYSDNRFRPVRNSSFFARRDVIKAAAAQMDTLKTQAQQTPRSLQSVINLARALRRSGHAQEASDLTAQAIRRIDIPTGNSAAYDDVADQFAWLLDLRADIRWDLGRFDESVATWRRAVELPNDRNHAALAINLAWVLCSLSKAQDALAILPAMDELTPYGKMQVAAIRVTAAFDRNDVDELEKMMAYLREHQRDAPRTLLRAELIMGRADEAAQVLIQRLRDPRMRTSALLDLQDYEEPAAPPRVMQWRSGLRKIRDRADVRAAVAQVGTVGRYPITSSFF